MQTVTALVCWLVVPLGISSHNLMHNLMLLDALQRIKVFLGDGGWLAHKREA